MQKLSVFLSHSRQDIETVRKIRDLFECIHCDAIMFYLKCLDDDNVILEDFIEKEIDARNIFVYCKSSNAEKSTWVQKELAYIKQKDSSRLYTIDLEDSFETSLAETLMRISKLIRNNNAILFYCPSASYFAHNVGEELSKAGYIVHYQQHINSTMNLPIWEVQKIHDSYASYLRDDVYPLMLRLCKKGIFIPIISNELNNPGEYSSYLFNDIIRKLCSERDVKVLPVQMNAKDYNETDIKVIVKRVIIESRDN